MPFALKSAGEGGWGVKDINVPKKNRSVLSISFPEGLHADLCNFQIIISDYNFLTDWIIYYVFPMNLLAAIN